MQRKTLSFQAHFYAFVTNWTKQGNLSEMTERLLDDQWGQSSLKISSRCQWLLYVQRCTHSHTDKHFGPLTFTHSPCHCLLSPIINIPISWSKWSSLYWILRMVSCVISFLLNWEARNCFSARRCHNKVWQLQLAILPPVPGKHLLFAMKTSKGLWILNCI